MLQVLDSQPCGRAAKVQKSETEEASPRFRVLEHSVELYSLRSTSRLQLVLIRP